jgi:hypothetical protein
MEVENCVKKHEKTALPYNLPPTKLILIFLDVFPTRARPPTRRRRFSLPFGQSRAVSIVGLISFTKLVVFPL